MSYTQINFSKKYAWTHPSEFVLRFEGGVSHTPPNHTVHAHSVVYTLLKSAATQNRYLQLVVYTLLKSA